MLRPDRSREGLISPGFSRDRSTPSALDVNIVTGTVIRTIRRYAILGPRLGMHESNSRVEPWTAYEQLHPVPGIPMRIGPIRPPSTRMSEVVTGSRTSFSTYSLPPCCTSVAGSGSGGSRTQLPSRFAPRSIGSARVPRSEGHYDISRPDRQIRYQTRINRSSGSSRLRSKGSLVITAWPRLCAQITT